MIGWFIREGKGEEGGGGGFKRDLSPSLPCPAGLLKLMHLSVSPSQPQPLWANTILKSIGKEGKNGGGGGGGGGRGRSLRSLLYPRQGKCIII